MLNARSLACAPDILLSTLCHVMRLLLVMRCCCDANILIISTRMLGTIANANINSFVRMTSHTNIQSCICDECTSISRVKVEVGHQVRIGKPNGVEDCQQCRQRAKSHVEERPSLWVGNGPVFWQVPRQYIQYYVHT